MLLIFLEDGRQHVGSLAANLTNRLLGGGGISLCLGVVSHLDRLVQVVERQLSELLGIDLRRLVVLFLSGGVRTNELLVVTLGSLELGGEGELWVTLDLGIQLGGSDEIALLLQALGKRDLQLGGMITTWTFLQIVVGVFHPLTFERGILLTALLPSVMIEAVFQKIGLGRVAAANLSEHLLDQVIALLSLIDLGGEPACLWIFSAVACLGIVLCRAGFILAREQNCG